MEPGRRCMGWHLAMLAILMLACRSSAQTFTVLNSSTLKPFSAGSTAPQSITIKFTDSSNPIDPTIFTTSVNKVTYSQPTPGQFNDAALQFTPQTTTIATRPSTSYTASIIVTPPLIYGTAPSLTASFNVIISKNGVAVAALQTTYTGVTVLRSAPTPPVFLSTNPKTVTAAAGPPSFSYSLLAQDLNSAPTLTFSTTVTSTSVAGIPTGLSTSASNVSTSTNAVGMCNTFNGTVSFNLPPLLVGGTPITATLKTSATTLAGLANKPPAASASWSVTVTFNPPVAQPPTITITTPLYASTSATSPLLFGQGQTITIPITVSDPNNKIQTPLNLQAVTNNGFTPTLQSWTSLANNTQILVTVKAPPGFSEATLNLTLTNAASKSSLTVIYLRTTDYTAPQINTKPASLILVSGQGFLDWTANDTNGIPQIPLTWTITQIPTDPTTNLALNQLTNGTVIQDVSTTAPSGNLVVTETGRFFFDPIIEPTDLTFTPITGTVNLMVTVTNLVGLQDQYQTGPIPVTVNAGADAIVFQGAECRVDPKVPSNCKKLLLNVHDSLVDAPPGSGVIVVRLRPYLTSATDTSGLHILYDPFKDANQLFGGTFDYLGAGAYTLTLVDVPVPWCMQNGTVPTTLPAACEVATMVAVSNHNGISDIYPAAFT